MKFVCRQCGICCRNLLQLREGAYRDQQGAFHTVSADSNGLDLWPWEREAFLKRMPSLDIRPLSFVVDASRKMALVMSYYMNHRDCPFCVDNRCSVEEEKPLTCRLFPLYGTLEGMGISSRCPYVVRPPMGEDPEENGRLIKEAYPDELRYLFTDMNVYRYMFELVERMHTNGIIVWNKEASVPEAMALLSRNAADIFDFAVDVGIMDREAYGRVVRAMTAAPEDFSVRVRREWTGV